MSIKLLVIDDHELIRAGLSTLLAGSGIKTVGEATSEAEAVRKVLKLKPDAVMLNAHLANGDGLAVLERIRAEAPGTKVITLSAYDNPTYVARAAALGACDFLLTRATGKDFVAAIAATAAGKSPSSVGQMRRVAGMMRLQDKSWDQEVRLTAREAQVVRHLALGLTNNEIGRSLGISVETVKEHVQNILRKNKLQHRTQAAVWAVRKGLA